MKLSRMLGGALIASSLLFASSSFAATPTPPAQVPPKAAGGVTFDVNEALNSMGAGFSDAMDKLGALAVEYGTKAVELAAAVVQAQSIATLVVGFIYLIGAIIAARLGYVFVRRTAQADWCEPSMDNIGAGFVGVVAFIGAFGFGLRASERLLDVWNWIGAFAPKLALAHMIFERVAGN